MVVIFGWGSGAAKDGGEIAPTTCPNCHNNVYLHLIRSNKEVSLYFVTMASYGAEEYLVCPVCRHGLRLEERHHAAVDGMRSATSLYRRGGLTEAAYQGTVADFWAKIGVAPSGQQVLHPATAAPSASTSVPASAREATADMSASLAGQLGDLAKLHGDGVLTDEEFTSAKRRLLGS